MSEPDSDSWRFPREAPRSMLAVLRLASAPVRVVRSRMVTGSLKSTRLAFLTKALLRINRGFFLTALRRCARTAAFCFALIFVLLADAGPARRPTVSAAITTSARKCETLSLMGWSPPPRWVIDFPHLRKSREANFPPREAPRHFSTLSAPFHGRYQPPG